MRPGTRLDLRLALALAAMLLAVACLYWPGMGGGFAFDDHPNIVDNAALRVGGEGGPGWAEAAFSSRSSKLQRPLAMLSFAAQHAVTGLDPRPMKIGNLVLHLLNAMLVFGLCLRLLAGWRRTHAPGVDGARDRWVALAIATAWALHPINLTGVLYIVQRMETLAHTFVFAGLWLYLSGRERQLDGRGGRGRILAALLGGTIGGLLAKESALLLPLYAALAESCLGRLHLRGAGADRPLRRLYLFVLVLPAIAAVAWLLPRALAPAAYASRDFTLVERLLTEARVLLDYLHWTLLPSVRALGLYHDDYTISRGLFSPPATALAIAALAALVAAAVALRRRRPLASLGIAWFLAAHVMTATFLPLELVHEHRNYFASLGVCLLLADLLLLAPATPGARRGLAVAAVALLLLFASTTWQRARDWSDPLRFAITEAEKHPASPRATYARAAALVRLTGYDPASPAMADAERALAQAANTGSGILAHQAALTLAARSGRPVDPRWWTGMQQRLRDGPLAASDVVALMALTRCAVQGACPFPRDAMQATYEAALSRSRHSGVLFLYGDYALGVLRDPALARDLWREAVRRAPGRTEFRGALARLLIAQDRDAEAVAQIEAVRAQGRFGQHAALADELEAELRRRQAQRERAAR